MIRPNPSFGSVWVKDDLVRRMDASRSSGSVSYRSVKCTQVCYTHWDGLRDGDRWWRRGDDMVVEGRAREMG